MLYFDTKSSHNGIQLPHASGLRVAQKVATRNECKRQKNRNESRFQVSCLTQWSRKNRERMETPERTLQKVTGIQVVAPKPIGS